MRTNLSCLIVDDEEGARLLLRRRLLAHPELVVVGEADSVLEAHRLSKALRPEVVFLDIGMPGNDGFELIPLLEPRPHIVFVTAYSDRAVDAFQVGAADYLMKPCSEERLAQTIDNLLQRGRRGSGVERAADPSPLRLESSLMVRTASGLSRVNVADIVLIEADVPYSRLTLATGKHHLVDHTITQWMERLPLAVFCRVDRFRIINVLKVAEVKYRREAREESAVDLKGVGQPMLLRRLATSRLRAALRGQTVK